MATTTTPISQQQRSGYRERGYMILQNIMTEEQLDLLRQECTAAIENIHADMDARGTDQIGISIRNSRYFVAQPSLKQPRLREFLFGELLADVCRATLGPNAYLNWEQFVVKAAEQGKAFSWHQDSGYAMAGGAEPHEPGVTCWCALDDMSEENGTIYVLPYERVGGDRLVEHEWNEETRDWVGYFGDDPGDPVIVPAGSIAVFSGRVFHRSGFNQTSRLRRVYLAQYRADVLHKKDSDEKFGRNEVFLSNNQIVAV